MNLPAKFQSSSSTYLRNWKLKAPQRTARDLYDDKMVEILRQRAFDLEAEAERLSDGVEYHCLMARVQELRDLAVSIRLGELG